MPTGCGAIYVTINEDEQGMFEVFTNMGKAGGCASSQAEAVSRLISLSLRAGIKVDEISRQLKGISCPQMTWWENGQKILSCADAISKAIEMYPAYVRNGSEFVPGAAQKKGHDDASVTVGTCPDCGGSVDYREGCMVCQLCGYSKC
jgi:ribonucleoside-diphosphate reductase alpha chain